MVTIITDIRVPADQFPLGRILQAYPEVEVEVERIIPTQEAIIPLFWVRSENEEAVLETLEDDPLVEGIVELTRMEGRILYSVNWSPDVDTLVRTLVDLHVDVLDAEGTADSWEFRLQFRRRAGLRRFRESCRAEGIDIELVELYNPLMPQERGPLSPEQKDALATAFENGYWDDPREITQGELAELIGLSDSQLSRRLREGVRLVVGEVVFGPGGMPYE